MNNFFKRLRDQLCFLDDDERDKIVEEYQHKVRQLIKDGKKPKEALKTIGTINQIVHKVCDEHNLNYDYCIRKNAFDKDISCVSKTIANFLREIIKVMRKIKLSCSLESFLEIVIKVIVLIFLFILFKLPFILLDSLALAINRFIFYPFNSSFDMVTRITLAFAYFIVCLIMTLKAFGRYQTKDKKIVKQEELDKVDYEYRWFEQVIRIIIYVIILLPLLILAGICLLLIIEAAYFVTRGIDLIGIPIALVGIFGLLCTIINVIRDSLNHKKRTYFLSIFLSIILIIVGIVIMVINFSQFKYPKSLDKSTLKLTEEEIQLNLTSENTKILLNNGNYELLLDNNLYDNEIKVVASYYDDYIDIKYDQKQREDKNYLIFDYQLDNDIKYYAIMDNVIKDMKKGYIFDYSNIKKFKLKIYANDHTKSQLENNQ